MSASNQERRRANRVQGTWNSAPKKQTRNSAPAGDCKTQQIYPKWTDKNVDCYPRRSEDHQFKYDNEVVEQVIQEENKTLVNKLVVDKPNVYELSKSKGGIPARIIFDPDFIPQAESDILFETLLHDLPWQTRMGVNRSGEQYPEPRQTCWFGLPYTYSHVSWQATEDSVWPPVLQQLRERIANFQGIEFNSVMCNLYRDGKDKIGWHADDEVSLGKHPTIASLSFGETRSFVLKKKDGHLVDSPVLADEVTVPLGHGSLVLMMGSLQEDWLHSVPPEYHDKSARVNLTFRVIVNHPNEHKTLLPNASHYYTLSERHGKLAANVYFTKSVIKSNFLQTIDKYLFTHTDWLSNAEDASLNYRRMLFSQSENWPDQVSFFAAHVSEICGNHKSKLPDFSSVEALLLQRMSESYPWQKNDHGPFLAVVAIGNEAVNRPLSMRKKLNSSARGNLKSASIVLGRGDVFHMTHSFFDDWEFQLPRCETKGGKGVIFLVLRLPDSVGSLASELRSASMNTTVDSESSCAHLCKTCSHCSSSIASSATPLCHLCAQEVARSVHLNSKG